MTPTSRQVVIARRLADNNVPLPPNAPGTRATEWPLEPLEGSLSSVSQDDRYSRRRAAFPIPMQRLLRATLAALILVSCSFGGGTPASRPLIQVLDERGPSTIGPSLLAGDSIAELSALIKGGGGDCPDACWSPTSDPAAAYLALVASDSCVDRDLATSIAGSALSITIAWRSISCIGVAARSSLIYSLVAVPRKSLPPGPVRITVRYSGRTVYHHAAPGDAVLDLTPPTDAAAAQSAVAAAVAAAFSDAGLAPRAGTLTSLYRLHCAGGSDSFVVRLSPTGGGPAFVGQYVGGQKPQPGQRCPAP